MKYRPLGKAAPRPIIGFGPAGWVLAAIAFTLVIVLVTGYDLRFQLQVILNELIGSDRMIRFTVYLIELTLLTDYPAIGIVTSLCVLPAVWIYPYD